MAELSQERFLQILILKAESHDLLPMPTSNSTYDVTIVVNDLDFVPLSRGTFLVRVTNLAGQQTHAVD
jgi:hypothetical protein